MAKILIVEDEEFFRTALAQYLTSKKHITFEAANGSIAKEMITSNPVDIIISDVQMPKINGIELLEWVRQAHPDMAFILMTGFTNLLETQSAYELGANEFLGKPFKNAELMDAIERILRKKSGLPLDEPENLDPQFLKISIEEFISRNQFEFDAFVRLSAKKYVRIGQSGDIIPSDRIRAYRDKGIHYLHISKNDFSKLVGFTANLIEVTKASIVEIESIQKNKDLLLTEAKTMLLKQIYQPELDRTDFLEAEEFLLCTLKVAMENKSLYELLSKLYKLSAAQFTNSLAVTVYAILIARKLGFTSSQLFFKLTLAGLFHDISMIEHPNEFFAKSYEDLSNEERVIYENHPLRSKEMLSEIKGVSSDIVQMVYEHHEYANGHGFPNKLNKMQIHPLSKILIVANQASDFSERGPGGVQIPSIKTVKKIEEDLPSQVDPATFVALKQIFGLD